MISLVNSYVLVFFEMFREVLPSCNILYTATCLSLGLSFQYAMLGYIECALDTLKKSFFCKANESMVKLFHFYNDSENKDGMQVKTSKVQRSNGNVSKDRTENVDNTARMNVDKLHEVSLTCTSNAHFPIDITTTQEISSMNQNNCISAESLQRFQQWKPGIEPEECWINDEVSFKAICIFHRAWCYGCWDCQIWLQSFHT